MNLIIIFVIFTSALLLSSVVRSDNFYPDSFNLEIGDEAKEYVPFRYRVGHVDIYHASHGPAPDAYTIKYRKHRIKGAAWSKMTEKKSFASYKDQIDNQDGNENESVFKTFQDMKNTNYRIPNDDKPKLWKGPTTCVMKRGDNVKGKSNMRKIVLRRYYSKIDESELTKCKGCNKYRGPKWSTYTTERFPVQKQCELPGPGEYYVAEPEISEGVIWMESIRFYKRASARFQRYTDILQCNKARMDEPGPADTAYSSDIGKHKSFNVKGTFGNPKAIIGTTNDEEVMSDVIEHPQGSTVKMNKAPFNVSSSWNTKILESPGPGDYNPPHGTIQFELCKKLPSRYAKYVAPFGTTQMQRPIEFNTGIPAPGTYDVQEIVCKPGPCGRVASTFTYRRDSYGLLVSKGSGLSPAHYNLQLAYRRLYTNNRSGKNRKPFDSTGPRFAQSDKGADVPDPATYYVNDAALKSGVAAATKMCAPVGKKAESESCTPGPGSYNIHPLYKDAMVKAHCSHNVTLVPYPNIYPIKPNYGPPLPKIILKTFVKGAK